MNRIISAAAFIAAGTSLLVLPAVAQTATDTIGVSLTVEAECTVSAADLAFGSTGLVDTDIDAQTDLTVECTAGSPYAIGLGAGAGVGATVAARLLTHTTVAANTAAYGLYQEAARTTNWGNTEGVDTVDSAGATGAPETVTVYGRVPAGQNIATGAYADTITATIWYGTGL